MGRRDGRNKRYRTQYTELFIFIGILAICTGFLAVGTVYFQTTAPPHAGVTVKDEGTHTVISVNNMGQSDTITVLADGEVVSKMIKGGARTALKNTPDNSRHIQVISDNGRQVLLLREFYI